MPFSQLPLCDEPAVLVPEILAEWQSITRDEPWLSLPLEHRFDSLPDVCINLLDASLCRPNSRAAYREKVEAAAQHGVDRRAQGMPQELIFTEYYLLREALWRVLRRRYPAQATTAVLRVDAAISAATRASLSGYHRPELERTGQWPAILDQLTDASPLLHEEAASRPDHGGPG